jgi:Domain of unknown function (DUF5655)/Domain of unknown function (DUF4287)
MARTAKKSLYSVHPSLGMVQSSLRILQEKTGKSADEWAAIVNAHGPADEKGRREWLKTKHGFTTNYAWWIADLSLGRGRENMDPDAYLKAAEGYVEAMFAGKRAALRPLYDRLLELGLGLGSDVKACPCATIVPLYRNHVFAQIKPASNTRIDLGFALGDRKVTGRLIDTGGFAKKDRITHRIPIESEKDINAETSKWLKTAYDRDGK